MIHLDLSPEEEDTLKSVLTENIKNLDIEILHADHLDFKKMLKHQREVLAKVLGRIQAAKNLTAQS